jgi:hypothetical protein
MQVDNVLVTDPALWTSDVDVASNLFTGVATEFRDCSALLSGYVARVTFEHNEIADPPNTGISMGWCVGGLARMLHLAVCDLWDGALLLLRQFYWGLLLSLQGLGTHSCWALVQ